MAGRLVVGAPYDVAFAFPGRGGTVFVFDLVHRRAAAHRRESEPGLWRHRWFRRCAARSDLLVGAPSAGFGGSAAGIAYLFDGVTGALLQTFASEDRPIADSGLHWPRSARTLSSALPAIPAVTPGAVHVFDAASGALLRSLASPFGLPAARSARP